VFYIRRTAAFRGPLTPAGARLTLLSGAPGKLGDARVMGGGMMRRFLRAGVAAVAVAATLPAAAAAQAVTQAPVLGFTPTANGVHDYGAVDVGQTASQTFTLTNSGGSATGALTIALAGAPAFDKTADSCTETSLGPRKSCSVTVEYAPTSAGQGDTAMLTATGKKPAATSSLTLTGASRLHLLFSGHFAVVHQQIDFAPACTFLRWRIDATADIDGEPSGIDLDPAEVHLDFCVDIGSFSEGTMSFGLPGGVLTGDLEFGFYFPGGTVGSPAPQDLSLAFEVTGGTGAFAGAGGSVLIGATWPRFQDLTNGSVNGTIDIPSL
jgi:hypothetical protein